MKFLKKKSYLAIIGIIIIITGYYWYKKSQSGDTQVQYVTEVAEKGTVTVSVSGSGNVIVDQSATVDPTITGTVANLAVNVGDKVEKGQLLFTIINNDLGVSVSKAAASYDSALNSLESAKIDKDSAKATYEKAKDDDEDDGDSYTTRELEVLKDKVDLAEAKVAQVEKSLTASLADYRNIQADAAKRNVLAPISGTVNAVNIKNGDDLSRVSGSSSNAQAPIILGDLSTLKAQVEINEVDISNVSIGQRVMMTFNAIDGLAASGKVEKIDSLGTLSSGVVSYNVTVGFDALDARVKPEMSVSAAIITNVKQDVLIVPNSAVKTQNGRSYVEVLTDKNTPEQKTVTLGAGNNTSTEIASGLSAGDRIVTQTINPTAATSSSATSSGSGRSGTNVRIPGVGGFGR